MSETIREAIVALSEAFQADRSFLLDFYSRLVEMAIKSGASPHRSQIGVEDFIKFMFHMDLRDYDFTVDRQETSGIAIKLRPEIVTVAEQFCDLEYGWGWFCHLAMLGYDTGGTHIAANKSARDFMIDVFDFDVAEQLPSRWQDLRLD
jgi:hypothetical protein